MLSRKQIRELPHVCRNYDPWERHENEQGEYVVFTECRVCGFGQEAHSLSATLQAYEELAIALEDMPKFGDRKELPIERHSMNKKFQLQWPPDDDGNIETLELYLIVGLYDNGQPGELIFFGSKVGDHLHGLLAALAITASRALKHGCPIEKVISKWRGTQFEPRGFTGDPEFPRCGSILDYLAQYLEARFVANPV